MSGHQSPKTMPQNVFRYIFTPILIIYLVKKVEIVLFGGLPRLYYPSILFLLLAIAKVSLVNATEIVARIWEYLCEVGISSRVLSVTMYKVDNTLSFMWWTEITLSFSCFLLIIVGRITVISKSNVFIIEDWKTLEVYRVFLWELKGFVIDITRMIFDMIVFSLLWC